MIANRRKALVIDDAEDWRDELQEFLQDEGYDVITVGDKLSAIKLLDSTAFAITIIDVNLADEMHNVDGLLINSYIQSEAIDTQVVLISARSLDAQQLLEIRPAIFIEKSDIRKQLGLFLAQLM